jgi:hypothetical protein
MRSPHETHDAERERKNVVFFTHLCTQHYFNYKSRRPLGKRENFDAAGSMPRRCASCQSTLFDLPSSTFSTSNVIVDLHARCVRVMQAGTSVCNANNETF